MEMICYIHVVAHFILMILNLAGAFDVPPPRDVKVVQSELQWLSPSSDDNVMYTVQYKRGSEPVDDWHNVTSHNGTKFAITKEVYGAIFRVRAEKEGHASEWQISNPVQCVHLNVCIPLMTVNVKPGKTYLSMSHMDKSFEKEYGVNIAFNISSWKVVTGVYSEVQFNVTNNKNEVILNLESGQMYCFQVQYSFYNKPYGNTSEQQCVIIPETPEEAKRRTFLTTILTTFCILTLCGCCIFLLFKNHKKYKQLLRPPVEFPGHLREFLSQEFSQQPSPSPSFQSLWSCDVITLIDNVSTEENGKERIS
ncbi:interferon gamma receptor 2 [Triplophysa rosa]|uniref:interferon gamma receptor 2 n=1 Tax=Triplophysa rosa TaxID=992332 RepID=UPI002545F1E4|nr:interferon gamma receptor 2 [Triplophysa rosa]XP_057216644.1 interferon gamma receptor 2 [Triplophysa rosa]XP_057216652.1 interferon gamma receptor 2 [Triplophysa rosa]